MVSVDADDQPTLDSLAKLSHSFPQVIVSTAPREDSRGEKYDRALTVAPADVYLPAVDCAPFISMGFDAEIVRKAELFPDGIGVVHTPFLGRGTFPPGLQAITANLVGKLGYIYSHEYPFWFIDHELHDLGRLIGRYFCANVDFRPDLWRPATTIRLRDVAFWATYYDMMAIERRAKARAIILSDDFKTPDWQKKDLIENFQVIENEAWRINQHVRDNAAHYEAQRGDKGPPDEGYLRAKAKAERKLAELLGALKQAA